MKTLFLESFRIFLPILIKIDSYNFELYRFKVGAFILRRCTLCHFSSKTLNIAILVYKLTYEKVIRMS